MNNNTLSNASSVRESYDVKTQGKIDLVKSQKSVLGRTWSKKDEQVITSEPVKDVISPAAKDELPIAEKEWKIIITPPTEVRREVKAELPQSLSIDQPFKFRFVLKEAGKLPAQPKVDLSKIDKNKLTSIIIEDHILKKRDSNSQRQIKYYAGKHMKVFEYDCFPGVIIKMTHLGGALMMMDCLQKCHQIKTSNLNYCHLPQAELIKLDGTTQAVVIMEKLDGNTNPMECMELSEREYEKFAENPALLNKWREYFKQAAEFICLTGYWDTDWRNILLMKDGFGFIDFESVDGSNLKGISRLIPMAPVECFDDILEIGLRYGLTNKDMLSRTTKEKRKAELELHTQIRAWHKKMNIQALQKIDPKELFKETIQFEIIKSLNEAIERQKDYSYYEGSLIMQRRLHCQPLMDFKKDDYDAALKKLQNKNLICTWTIEENSYEPNLHIYQIYS